MVDFAVVHWLLVGWLVGCYVQAMATEQLENEASAYYCSSRCLDDGIIDPRDTRCVRVFKCVLLCSCACMHVCTRTTMKMQVARFKAKSKGKAHFGVPA